MRCSVRNTCSGDGCLAMPDKELKLQDPLERLDRDLQAADAVVVSCSKEHVMWRIFLCFFFGFMASLQPAALIDRDMKTQFHFCFTPMLVNMKYHISISIKAGQRPLESSVQFLASNCPASGCLNGSRRDQISRCNVFRNYIARSKTTNELTDKTIPRYRG